MSHTNKPFRSRYGVQSDAPIVNTNTDYNVEPGGTTEQRPTTPANKASRLNTTTKKPEFYLDGRWISVVTSDDLSDLDDSAFFYAIALS